MKQSTLTDFFKSNKPISKSKTNTESKSKTESKSETKTESKTVLKVKVKVKPKLEMLESYLVIDIEKAKKKLSKLDDMCDILYNHYIEKDERKPLNQIKKHFEIFYDDKVLELISLFERPIPYDKKYYRRLANEFYLIKEKNFFEVFKQVKEILNMTTEYPHVIRGSAGCSLVCFLMKITDLDPIYLRIGLTRFMHENREDMPDIDIDFPAHDRNKIYEKIFQRWKNRVARISNHVIYKEKSALKDAIRETGYHKFIPKDFDLYQMFDDKETIRKILDSAKEKIGTFKNYSLHCGGIVIFKDKVPDKYFLKDFDIYKDDTKKGKQIKLNKDEVEDNGLIKIDILSNKGLSQLWDISHKKILDYDFHDKNVYNFLAQGENLGLTYGESRGMRKIFVEMKPQNIHDIATALALIRPAASKSGQKFTFLKDYHLTNKVERNKFVVYDDDAIEYISKLLRISPSYADIYRKAFSKGKFYKIKEFREKLECCQPRMSVDDIDLIMDRLDGLKSYGFCKSHAYSYAYLVYILAYNKYYNPKKFWKSTLKNCCTSYRKWTHLREGIIHNVEMNKYIKCDRNLSPEKQYFAQGFWIGKDFLKNMYVKYDEEEYQKKLESIEQVKLGNTVSKKVIVNVEFRGLIATHKIYKSCNKLNNISRFITFVTIGYDNGQYIDLVLFGCQKLSKAHCIQGFGTYEEGRWIRVEKFTFSYLN